MKISELLDGIRKSDLVLPEFQREFVWTREQAKQLFVSLVKGYPVGSLLFWKTDTPPDLKNLPKIPEKLGLISVILDGQQRLTTLYLLIEGEVPPYYTATDLQTDPRDLFFNLETGDFQYYQATRMRDNPLWCSVVECFAPPGSLEEDINVFEIAQMVATDDSQHSFQFAQLFNENLNNLRGVKSVDLPVQTVPSHANIDDAIDIFDRVNSQGTKLTDAELALTHVTGKWPRARVEMKAKIADLATRNFYFDLTFMTRALTGVVTQRALFPSIHDRQYDELIADWKQLDHILDYLATILPQKAFIHSTEDLNATNVLVPIIVYLSLNGNHFPNNTAMIQAMHWLYAAHTWSRYTSQTDQRLEHDLSLIVRNPQPWSELCDQIIDQRGRIEVKPSDLEGRGIQHPLFRMTYMLAKAHNAVDWFNGAPLGTTFGKAYAIHNHHIFPQAVLYKNGYDPDNHLHRKIINEIANRAVLTADTNMSLSDTLPEEYLPQVEAHFPGALAGQFIPMDPELWRLERFPDFLEARRELIARKLNEFMAALITEPIPLHEYSAAEIIQLGESATLEFKSTLRWDMVQQRANKDLHISVIKTIAAFLNTDGGTLIIGVEDGGNLIGLDYDLSTLHRPMTDHFEQVLMNLIDDHIGPEFGRFIKVRFEPINGCLVCMVSVDKAPEPAFVHTARGREFFARVGNTTHSLDPEETVRFIETSWQ